MTRTDDLAGAVRAAVAAVDDPELPGVSIVEMGIVDRVDVDAAGRVAVALVPTYTGCPALPMIRHDVEVAVGAVAGVTAVDVRFVSSTAWTIARITNTGRRRLAGELGIAVDAPAGVRCPRCGASAVEVSPFGPTRCRAVHRCEACGEPVEAVR
jgi:ring-1,2-phenylacetyl-CoA epoxidase subunit PaaD